MFVVERQEHHCLGTCPCSACQEERERRSRSLRAVPPKVAYTLGIISHLSPAGSVARGLMNKERSRGENDGRSDCEGIGSIRPPHG